ncbi:hypothetical protein KUCAC02_004575, partial [Chaenocephalus aceratus]
LPILEIRLFVIYSLTVLTDDDIRELRDVDPGAAVLTSLENSDTDTASSDTDSEEHPDLPEPLTALFDATLRELSPQEMNMKSPPAERRSFSVSEENSENRGAPHIFCVSKTLLFKVSRVLLLLFALLGDYQHSALSDLQNMQRLEIRLYEEMLIQGQP